ncbi:MAG: nucleotide pyrophosphatase, partial [Gemmatimonadetes bacterium]|nr:nucleotide pyrophosphatase [Gemmatimonadota bacterium]
MNLFRRSRPDRPRRLVVVGLDGTPHSLLTRLVREGRMPNFSGLLKEGSLVPLQSVLPTVSSVAWTSIVTGCNPGKHNIFGFVDRVPQTYEMYIPGSRHVLAPTWVDLFSQQGLRVFSMGVPGTYPPKPVNGILISGFLAPSLEKAAYPEGVAAELSEMGYVIDIDAWQARENTDRFLDEVFLALERRCEAMLHYLAREKWDLFVAHIMDTDRLHHFLWGQMETGSEVYEPWFYRFYARVDAALGELADRLDDDTLLVILSDHGFCRMKQEVHVNTWLKQAGLLSFDTPAPKQLRDIAPSSRCYSLLPGRIYVRVRGREYEGCVSPGADYETVRRDVASGLEGLVDTETGERVVERVYMRE